MISRIFKALVAIFFPWLILLLEDKPGDAVIALIMQASILGWPFAAAWALRVQRGVRKAKAAEAAKATKMKIAEEAKKMAQEAQKAKEIKE